MKDPLGETKTIKISHAQPENTEKKKNPLVGKSTDLREGT